ncbi:MAG: radical SAM protein [Methanoregula sp.]|jgi:radical SAM superfamily enzyme YgiQ (UPF0313 family)
MKILFVVKSMTIENLGVQYLSAVTKQAGHEAKIVELNEAFVSAKICNPDIIGMSIMTGDQQKFKNLAGRIKGWWPCGKKSPTIVAGGPHPTFFRDDFAEKWRDSDFDMIIPGEAEQEWAELMGSPAKYPDLDAIPWPDRADFRDRPIRDFIGSRGCFFSCRYCSQNRWAALYPDVDRVRMRSVDDVIKELASLKDAKFFYAQDSCFSPYIKWLREFSPKYRLNIGKPFHCHARPAQITDEYARLLSRAGCYSLRFALETASPSLRELIGRGMTTNEEALNASEMCREYGIKFMVQNILSLPKSTIEDDLATLEMNIRCRPDYAWASIFSPFPGTDLGDQCVEEGWYDGDYDAISDSFFDRSVLNFSDEYKEQTYYLQKCFALAVEAQEMPKVEELTSERFPLLVHRLMRKVGDGRLYGGIV